MIRHISIGDADYPKSLDDLGEKRPRSFSVEGDFSPAPLCVAIVGSREPLAEMTAFVKRLARAIASHDGVVVSGGAVGIDTAAHEGALEGGGRTWSVIDCKAPQVTPAGNKSLFDQIAANRGAIIRTAQDDRTSRKQHLDRNPILVALANVLVVVQAGKPSGTWSSATAGLRLHRPMWVVPNVPWLGRDDQFKGTWTLLHGRHPNVRALHSETEFLAEVLGRKPAKARKPPKGLTDDELKVFEVLGNDPKHPDEIALQSGLPTPAVTTALLTLALGDVVVEGSAGLFHRKDPP